MKTVLVLVSVLSLTLALPTQRGLVNDFKEFFDLLPLEEIVEVFEYYRANDPEVQAILEYAWSEDLKEVIGDVYALPGTKDLVEWIFRHLARTDVRLEHKSIQKRFKYTAGWNGCLQEILNILPISDLLALAVNKLAEQGTFYQLVMKIQSMRDHYEQVITLPSVVKYLGNLRNLGVDVDALDEFIRAIFEWY